MRVVIDTDPAMGVLGSDPEDAFALSYCLAHDELDVAAVTVVNGNVPADLGYRNTRHILDLLGAADVPLAVGPTRSLSPRRTDVAAWQALRREQRVISPPLESVPPVGAPQLLVDTVLGSAEPVTVLAIGPLTNLALGLLLEPRLAERVARVVVMGGKGRVGGNVTPEAEFNFWCDPEAAEIVLAAGWPLTLVTLEVCNQVRMTPELFDTAGTQTAFGAFARESCAPWFAAHPEDGTAGFPLFDTLAAAVVADPELVRTERAHVLVETSHGPAGGADACWLGSDVLGEPLTTTNADLAVAVDAGGFLELFGKYVLERL